MGRKVKHLGGGSEALHGSRVGFSCKIQCSRNFYRNLNVFHLMELESTPLCLIIINIDTISNTIFYYHYFQTLPFSIENDHYQAFLYKMFNINRERMYFFQSNTNYILNQMHRIHVLDSLTNK